MLKPSREGFLVSATAEESFIVREHFEYLKDLNSKNIAIFVGRTEDETPIGLVVFKTSSLEQANQLMNNDPAVKKGIFLAEIKPFRLAFGDTSSAAE